MSFLIIGGISYNPVFAPRPHQFADSETDFHSGEYTLSHCHQELNCHSLTIVFQACEQFSEYVLASSLNISYPCRSFHTEFRGYRQFAFSLYQFVSLSTMYFSSTIFSNISFNTIHLSSGCSTQIVYVSKIPPSSCRVSVNCNSCKESVNCRVHSFHLVTGVLYGLWISFFQHRKQHTTSSFSVSQ